MPDTAFSLKEAGEILAKAAGLKPGVYLFGVEINHTVTNFSMSGKVEDSLPGIAARVQSIVLTPLSVGTPESACTFRVKSDIGTMTASEMAALDRDHLC